MMPELTCHRRRHRRRWWSFVEDVTTGAVVANRRAVGAASRESAQCRATKGATRVSPKSDNTDGDRARARARTTTTARLPPRHPDETRKVTKSTTRQRGCGGAFPTAGRKTPRGARLTAWQMYSKCIVSPFRTDRRRASRVADGRRDRVVETSRACRPEREVARARARARSWWRRRRQQEERGWHRATMAVARSRRHGAAVRPRRFASRERLGEHDDQPTTPIERPTNASGDRSSLRATTPFDTSSSSAIPDMSKRHRAALSQIRFVFSSWCRPRLRFSHSASRARVPSACSSFNVSFFLRLFFFLILSFSYSYSFSFSSLRGCGSPSRDIRGR